MIRQHEDDAFYREAYSLKEMKDKIVEWILLKLGKCPACKAGIFPHRNCWMR